jgi:hypothetical protein
MKSAFAFLTVAVVLVGLSGCQGPCGCRPDGFLSPHGRCLIDGSCGHCADCPDTCQSCDTNDCGACADYGTCGPCNECAEEPVCEEPCEQRCTLMDRIRARRYVNPGPPTGAIAYPYYTLRGPRDFLASNPSSIGP